MNEITKIVQALKDSNILLQQVTNTIENETKEQTVGFSSMLLDTLTVNLLGNILAGKRIARDVMEKNGIFNAASSFNKL